MHHHNNFLIFREVFWHTLYQKPLYEYYPEVYFDHNVYGPFFSLIIAPFAVVPVWLGLVLWCVALSMFLYWAVCKSTLCKYQQIFIFWFCAHELLTALFMQQFNVAIAAIILLSFWFVEKERDEWATFFIVIGTLVKLYGVVGLAFFFFSKHKVKYVLSFMLWLVILFCLPMLYSGVDYQLEQYREWYYCLLDKNADNMFSGGTNISLLGLFRKISHCATYSDLWLIVPGLLLFGLPCLRLAQYGNVAFRQTLLASVLMFVCLFSTGTESSGYIIALTGVVIWYTAAPWKRTGWDIALMVFAFILTSMSPSDLFPAYLRKELVQPYALKALPVAIVWFRLCYEMLTKDYGADGSGTPATGPCRQLIRRFAEDERLMQFVRFCITGTLAAAVHYGIYFVLQRWINVNVAYAAGYLLSAVGNFFLTSYFTFRTLPSWKKFLGFAGSHGLNFVLHNVLFYLFLLLGVHRLVAPPLVMLVAMLVQFSILRVVFMSRRSRAV